MGLNNTLVFILNSPILCPLKTLKYSKTTFNKIRQIDLKFAISNDYVHSIQHNL